MDPLNTAVKFCYKKLFTFSILKRLPWWLRGKESTCNAGEGVQYLGQEDPLEKEMATYSSIFVWEIPWTEVVGYNAWGHRRV